MFSYWPRIGVTLSNLRQRDARQVPAMPSRAERSSASTREGRDSPSRPPSAGFWRPRARILKP